MKISFLKKVILFSWSLILLTLLLGGCNTTGTYSAKDTYPDQEQKNDLSGDSRDNSLEGQKEEETVKEYIPNESDVILKNNDLENGNILKNFMEVAGENNESQIRIVKYVRSQGVIIYDLKSRYDKNAKEGWIRVVPDLSYYKASENEVQDVFNSAPQQCGDLSKNIVEGYYTLNKCRTHWEYRLLPVISDNDS